MQTKENIATAGVVELRKIIRENGTREAWIASASKAELVAFIERGERPAHGATVASNGATAADSAAQIAAAIQSIIAATPAGLDADAVREIVRAELSEVKPVPPVQIVLNGKPGTVLAEKTHEKFSEVCRLVAAGLPVMLVGPAGSGKTTLAAQVAKALGRTFTYNSLSAGTSESHILGRTLPDASGAWTFKPAPFVETYRNGGIHLFDEVDAADPNLLVVINAALANGHLSIPFAGITVERHAETAIIMAGNTWGNGASRQYVGRNQLDAATLDRVAVSTVFVDYDAELEAALCPVPEVLAWGRKVREGINGGGLRRILSTRTLVNASRLVLAGETLSTVAERYFAGWTREERNRAEG